MECIFEGCQKPNMAYGYCQGHAAQIRRGKPLAPLGRYRPPSPEGQWWCSKCKQHKAIDDFGYDKTRDQPDRVCRACRAEYMRGYNEKNKDRIRVKVTTGKWRISEEKYLELFEAQGHKCAICGLERRSKKRLCLDHNHKTGLARGLLCQDCNLGMGQFADDPDLVQKVVDYLRNDGVIHDPELRMPEDSWQGQRTKERDALRARNRGNID